MSTIVLTFVEMFEQRSGIFSLTQAIEMLRGKVVVRDFNVSNLRIVWPLCGVLPRYNRSRSHIIIDLHNSRIPALAIYSVSINHSIFIVLHYFASIIVTMSIKLLVVTFIYSRLSFILIL